MSSANIFTQHSKSSFIATLSQWSCHSCAGLNFWWIKFVALLLSDRRLGMSDNVLLVYISMNFEFVKLGTNNLI